MGKPWRSPWLEKIPLRMEMNDIMEDQEDSHDDIGGLLYDTFRNIAEVEGLSERPNGDARKFFNLVNQAKQELYPGCKNFSILSFVIRLYLLNCLYRWINASFTSLLELLKEVVLDLNIL